MSTLMITTSTKLASISIYKDGSMLGNISINVKKTHSTYILEEIKSILTWTQTSINDITKVIVSIGPGSFTGVRIALSVIKAMFVSRDVKIYEVNELDAIGYQNYCVTKQNNVAIIDANKEKVYYGLYIEGKRASDLMVGKLDDAIKLAKENNATVSGDGALNYMPKILENGIEIKAIEAFLVLNANIFYDMLIKGMLKEVDIFNLVPDYLEKSNAEKEQNGNI